MDPLQSSKLVANLRRAEQVDPAKLVPPPPSAVQIFMQRINANYPPTFYKGIPIDTSHLLRKYILPMSSA